MKGTEARFRFSTSWTCSGFTLVELMVSILIFGVVMTTIFASYRTVFSSAGRVDSGIDRYDMAGICLNRMIQDLQNTHVSLPPVYRKPEFDDPPDPNGVVGESSDPENGEFPRLGFSSLAHIPFDRSARSGIARIVYYVQEGSGGDFQLKRSDTLSPTQPFERREADPVLCDHLKSLEFSYVDHEGEVHDHWDSDSDEFRYATPVAIRISVEIGLRENSIPFHTGILIPVVREPLK